MEKTHTDHPPFWKQLLGAFVGMTIALGVYAVYTSVSPYVIEMLPASITTPRMKAARYTEEDRQVKQDAIIRIAREIVKRR